MLFRNFGVPELCWCSLWRSSSSVLVALAGWARNSAGDPRVQE